MNEGGSIFTMLTVVFVTLKLVGVIEWPWVWVLAPFWGPIAVVVVGFVVTLIGYAIHQHARTSI